MKTVRLLIVLFTSMIIGISAISQNVSVNVLTKDSGIVQKGKTVLFEVTINNTDPSVIVGIYKLKVQITVADSGTVTIQNAGHNLPTGWEIISNNGNILTISNGKDLIAPNDARTLLIVLEGKNTGGPVSVSGQLFFSNGSSPGTEPGSLSGDKPADNYSTSSCKVIRMVNLFKITKMNFTMKNNLKKMLLLCTASFFLSAVIAQNVSLNMLVLNSGVVPLNGNGTLQATVNATTGTAGQTNAVATGKVNVQITVPPSLTISATQNNLPTGWLVRNNNGSVINLCNNTASISVNTAVDLLIDLQGVTATTGSPTISGQLSFRTNCNAPGSLSGDNPSDNSSQAGFTVAGTVPVQLTDFSVSLVNCKPVLHWTTEAETNSGSFEIERSVQNSFNWVSIGTVAAGGSSNIATKYSFVDNAAATSAQKTLYRLKITDRDGSYHYSDILPVSTNCKTQQINVYPNPAEGGILYATITGLDKMTQASLLSLSGQVVSKFNVSNGTNKLNITNITSGQYILKVNFQNGTSERIKVLIIR